MIAKRALGAPGVLDLVGPFRQVRIPDQIVAAHGQPVQVGEVEQGVGLVESKGVGVGPKRPPFQLVDRDDLRAIGVNRLPEPNVGLQVRQGDRRSIAIATTARAGGQQRRAEPTAAEAAATRLPAMSSRLLIFISLLPSADMVAEYQIAASNRTSFPQLR